MKSSFGSLLSLSCLHGFSNVVGIFDCIIDGMMCREDGGVCLKIFSLCFSYTMCITVSCIRCAGALYVKSFIIFGVMDSWEVSFNVDIISVICLFRVLNMVPSFLVHLE